MVYVLTVDQISSRQQSDAVATALDDLSSISARLPFERTAGDEFQGVLDDPASVVTTILSLMRTISEPKESGHPSWHIGLGIGPVETPLPDSTRSGRGPAFLAARRAVEASKSDPSHLSIQATEGAADEARDAEVMARLLAAIRDRRSPQGWQAIDAFTERGSMSAAAESLGISRQAVGQRLAAAQWSLETDTVPALTRLLARVDAAAAKQAT